jgi:uncharacterized protein YyaL (SSP411 family)
MMISAFARAGLVLLDDDYVRAATKAAQFVLGRMRDEDGSLFRTYRDGARATASFLDDYASMVGACLDLYETTGDSEWLQNAIELQRKQDEDYLDVQGGGYYLTANDGEALLVREKPAYDRAVPSGNSIAAANLLRLHDLTGEAEWRRSAERLFASFAFRVTRSPTAFPMLLVALDHYYDLPLEIAIISPETRHVTGPIAERLRAAFVPNKALAVVSESEAARQKAWVPWLEGKRSVQGNTTAYVCERGRCDLPTSSPTVFAKQIDRPKPYPSFAKTPPPKLPFERAK